MQKTRLNVKNLAKHYRKKEVVNDVSMTIESGKVMGLLGPNGAGKTTLFYMISGLVKPDKGEIFLDEHNITDLPIHRRALLGIGYLPQESSVFTKMSVEDNIACILEFNHTPQETQDRLEKLLQEFGLNHIRKSFGFQLSGGERRRVEIARALASNPKFILLDEPFAGVDPISINDIKTLITDLAKKEIGVIITDHNVHETLSICDCVYVIHQGSILASGSPQEIVQAEKVKQAYLGESFTQR